jgi:hypothetical protein
MVSDDKKRVLALFAEGRELYKIQDFGQAKKKFAEALKIDSNDGPSQVYYMRCDHYIKNPPSPGWDGVFVMNTK